MSTPTPHPPLARAGVHPRPRPRSRRAAVVAAIGLGVLFGCDRGGTTPDDGPPATAPAPPAAATPVPTGIFASGIWSCAPLESGNTRCWGGRQGVSARRAHYPAGRVQALAAGRAHTCMLIGDGEVWCWGGNIGGGLAASQDVLRAAFRNRLRVALPGPAVDLDTARDHSCAALADGSVWCWGGEFSGDDNLPGPVVGWTGLTDVWAGRGGVCARGADGVVYCEGSFGPIGLVQGANPALEGATDIVFGDAHACALLGDGALVCAGRNGVGQLGTGRPGRSEAFVPVAEPGPWIAVAAGENFNCAVDAVGDVWCWGAALRGQLGRDFRGAALEVDDSVDTAEPGDDTPSNRAPLRVDGLSGVTAIAAGDVHACAYSAGTVRCWGGNGHDQLGDGNRADRVDPVDPFADHLP